MKSRQHAKERVRWRRIGDQLSGGASALRSFYPADDIPRKVRKALSVLARHVGSAEIMHDAEREAETAAIAAEMEKR